MTNGQYYSRKLSLSNIFRLSTGKTVDEMFTLKVVVAVSLKQHYKRARKRAAKVQIACQFAKGALDISKAGTPDMLRQGAKVCHVGTALSAATGGCMLHCNINDFFNM